MSVHQAQSLRHRIFRSFVHGIERSVSAISRDAYMKMAVEIAEDLDRTVVVDTGKGVIRFHCDSEISRIRATGALTREPDTIAWIDGFDPGDTLLDIGSNVGVFTLYAAVVRKVRVVACDPLPQNHRALVHNAVINGVAERVTAICAALSDRSTIAALSIPAIANTDGGAGATFGETHDNYRREIPAAFTLNTIGLSVDDLVERFGMAVPTHLKMDIDGIQDKVIAGAANTLRDPALKSAMLELQPVANPENRRVYDEIMAAMRDAGFDLDKVARATPNMTADIEKYPTNNFFVRRA